MKTRLFSQFVLVVSLTLMSSASGALAQRPEPVDPPEAWSQTQKLELVGQIGASTNSEVGFCNTPRHAQDVAVAPAIRPGSFRSNLQTVPGIRVLGYVLDEQGTPHQGLRVQVVDLGGMVQDETRTDVHGRYRFFDLPVGHYQLQALDGDGRPLALEADTSINIWPEHAQAPIEVILRLAAPVSNSGTNAGVPPLTSAHREQPSGAQANGYITGVVTAADTGLPQGSITVSVYNTSGDLQTSGYPNYSTGMYSITVPPGTYKVKFSPGAGSTYAPEWYDNRRDFASAAQVSVADGVVTPNINAALEIGGKITGRVTAADSGLSLEYVWVRAYTSITSTSSVAYGITYASGIYTITGLLTGTYYLEFNPSDGLDYLEEYYNDKRSLASADGIAVTLASVTSGIDAALEIGGKVTGRVTAAASGLPLQSVHVYAYTSTTSTSFVAYDSTDVSGIYTITRLLTGTYYLEFYPPYESDYVTEYYNDKPSLAIADAIPVTLGGVASGIDAALQTSGKIAGQVTAAIGGAPLQNVTVYAYTSTTSALWNDVAFASTDASGRYTITRLLAGAHYLRFQPPSGSDYLEEYYNDKRSLATANGIPVTLGSVTSGINAALEAGGKITGRVTAADSSLPLQNIDIHVYSSITGTPSVYYPYIDASGMYTITHLLAGIYYLKFVPPYESDYLEEYYNDKRSLATADGIPVTFGGVTSGIDAALTLGGKITGRVTAADTGMPLQDVDVHVYDCAHRRAWWAYTDATGVYTITRLPTSGYYVYFWPPDSGPAATYIGQRHANVVNVTAPNVVSNINAALVRGGQITGRVTAGDSGAGLSEVWVDVIDASTDDYIGDGYTDATGVYTTTGLPSGSYKLEFYPSSYGASSAYVRQYYNNKPDLASADVVNVTAPNEVSNINQVLTRGGQITGRVTASDTHLPLSGISISVYDSNGDWVGYAGMGPSGVYTTTGLPTGSYRIRFVPYSWGSAESYAYEYYNNKLTLASADVIPVTSPNLVSNIDVALDRGGQISGWVTAADTGLPLEDVWVGVYDSSGAQVASTYSDEAGAYLIPGLPTGGYRLRFTGISFYSSGCSVSKRYASYYNNKPDLASADVVPVTAPLTTADINQSLPLSPPGAPASVTGVTISGPATGYEQTSYTFNAAVSPVTATTPITYVWQATGQSLVTHTGRGASDSTSFTWSTAGSKTITVTASNALGAASNVYAINISGPPPPQAPTGVTISGPTVGFTQTSLIFNAVVSPVTATTPITYVWQATEQSAVTHTGDGTSDSVSFTWTTTGTKAITVTASNALGAVVGNHTVDISAVQCRVYLPVVTRH